MIKAVSAENLIKKYGNFTAVNGISFDISEGECFGFLGPNGAGKSTTVRMIHCVSPITSGTIVVFGERASIESRIIKKMTGVIPQEITLDPDLTVYENLSVFAAFFDIPRSVAKKRIGELLEFIELTNKSRCRIDELSTGMKRRLLIARSMLNQPKLIIADEPTTGLDPQARHLIWQRLRSLKKKGTTLILTTQYMEEAQQLCDRIVILNEGRILRLGCPQKMIQDEIGKEVIEVRIPQEEDKTLLDSLMGLYIGHERAGDTLYLYCDDGFPLKKRIVELNLTKVLNRPSTLEDVFLKLTGRSLQE
ncbi:MAG: ATP-binding cassette domain-containing protein [Candidatus Aureabacteria bacterium]|nr:ATP-binding cassette domain-containing protein [Candidatus Auribacterota bacterium]